MLGLGDDYRRELMGDEIMVGLGGSHVDLGLSAMVRWGAKATGGEGGGGGG